jgi:hypothetical protein
MKKLCIAALLSVLSFSVVSANVTFYDEAIDGEINPFATIVLGVGVNTIIGNVSLPEFGVRTDHDVFRPVLTTGTRISRIDVEITRLSPFFPGRLRTPFGQFQTRPPSQTNNPFPGVLTGNTFSYSIYDGANIPDPIGPAQEIIGFDAFAVGTSADYTLRITVSSIPEPATWLMMIVGFGVTGFALRRRQRSQKIAA